MKHILAISAILLCCTSITSCDYGSNTDNSDDDEYDSEVIEGQNHIYRY